MDRQTSSGQSIVTYKGKLVIKQFNDEEDYRQEKQLLTALTPLSPQALPRVESYDDAKHRITMLNAGQPLDGIDWYPDRHKWAERIACAMSPIWAAQLDLGEYTATGERGFKYVHDFLKAGYRTELARIGIPSQLVRQTEQWLTASVQKVQKEARGQSRIIHFDLSPRNVLTQGANVVVIDWSRAIRSEPVFEMGIMREKFDLIGETTSYLAGTPMANADIAAADRIARCFRIYRKAKQVGRGLTMKGYTDILHDILDSHA